MARDTEESKRPLLTTVEAARILEVGTSTLKRWADEGNIACVRTAGGHRRFRREDLASFRCHEAGTAPGPRSQTDAWLRLLVTDADSHSVAGELYAARGRLGAWWRVAEELGLVLQVVGERWRDGQLSITEEHIASNHLQRGVQQCVQGIPVARDAPCLLLATAEGDEHTLGLQLVELCAREVGFRSRFVGANSPVEDLIAHVGGARAVALSASGYSGDAEKLRGQYELVAAATRARGSWLILGGEGQWPAVPEYGFRVRSFEHLQRVLVECYRAPQS